jgi:hypothetical protein
MKDASEYTGFGSDIENLEFEIIDSIYAEMNDVMNNLEGSQSYTGTYDPLINHSIVKTLTLDVPNIDPE